MSQKYCNGDSTAITAVTALSELTGNVSIAQLPSGTATGSGAVVMQTSPALLGSPTVPTQALSDNSTTAVNSAWVKGQGYGAGGGAVSSVFTRTGAVVSASGDYTVAQVTGAAPLASPTFTGTPVAPTPATSDNSTTIPTTAFVKAQGYLTSNAVASVFSRTGAVAAVSGDYTVAQVTGAAPLASPTFTGTVTLPSGQALVAPVLGTPASGTLTNCTFPTLNQNTSGTAAGLTGTPNIACGTISATGQITSTVSTGTAPLVIASTTQVANLNAATLGGATFASPGSIGSTTAGSGAFSTISATGQITSTVATGTAPLVVASTTVVANLNASALSGGTFASPLPIGGTAPAAITGTTIQAKRLNVHGGTALVAGDIALSAGWGTSPTLTINRGVDQAASIQITAKATVAANPTVVVTFHDGTFTQIPVVVACRTDVTSANSTPTAAITNQWAVTTVTATAVTFTFVGTPVANSIYGLAYIALGI